MERRTAVDTAVTIPLSCSDADGDPLTLAIGQGPSKGTLGAISAGEVTYTPDDGAFGPDSFTYTADDGQGDGAPATVSITISRPPRCDDASVRTAVDTAVLVPLVCSDPDGDPLTLSAVTLPSKGTLGAIVGGMVTYTPASGEYGADSFTFQADDGTRVSPPATVDVSISRPPTCDDASLTARAGTAVTIPLTCADADGDDLTLAQATGPGQGTLSAFGASSVTYTPDLDADGQDSFTYTASDGVATSQPATVTIAITHPPRCDAISRRTRAGTPVSVPLSCSDADDDPLTLSIAGGPSKGTLGAVSGGAVTYTPNAGASGRDSFTYVADDGTSDSAPATATITISRAPVCQDLTRKTAVGQAVSVTLVCLDQDGDPLTLSVVDPPAHGSLGAIADGKIEYTPADGYFGPDSFTYRADDGDGGTLETATVSITVTRPPACDPVSADTPAGQPVEVMLTCTDPDGDDVTLETASGPAHGTLGAISGGKVNYTPSAHSSGPDSFTYRASDGTATSTPATVSITVIPPPNTAPTCDPVAKTAAAGEATEIQLSCSDGEDDALTLSVVDGPTHGTLGTIAGGKVSYTPDDGYHGEDSFTYRASDGELVSSPATVTLNVIAPPTVSLAVDHSSAAKGATLHFVATADDPDGGSIDEYRYSVDGAVVQTGASASLARRFDTPGTHAVAVRAKDDEGQTATATKTVTISAPSGGGSTAPPPSGGPPAPPAAGGPSGGPPSPPTLAVAKQKLKAVLAKGLAVRVTCSCTLKLQLVVDKKTAKKLKLGKQATVIGTLTRTVGGSVKLKIKLTAKARKALKKARSVKLTVRAGAVTKRVTVKG